jgi:hypothetical protein
MTIATQRMPRPTSIAADNTFFGQQIPLLNKWREQIVIQFLKT